MPSTQTPDRSPHAPHTPFLEEGLAAIREGRLDVAVAALGRAVEQDPDYPSLHNYAVALARVGRLDDAIARFEDALRLKPNSGDTRRNLALAQRQRGNPRAAAATLAAAVAAEPAATDLRIQLGQLL